MNLIDYELFPAVVTDIKDARSLGRIKCTIPGEMDKSSIDEDLLPYVKPFANYGSFGVPQVGKKVWVLKNKRGDNNDYWYIPMYDPSTNEHNYMQSNSGSDTDVIMSKDNGYTQALLTYDKKNGFTMKAGNNASMTMNDNGSVNISTNGGHINISNDNISINEGNEQAVLGNALRETLADLAQGLVNLSNIAMSCPYTTPLSTELMNMGLKLSDALNWILSEKIKIS